MNKINYNSQFLICVFEMKLGKKRKENSKNASRRRTILKMFSIPKGKCVAFKGINPIYRGIKLENRVATKSSKAVLLPVY